MPSRPSSPISRRRSVGHRASSHASGARARDLLLGEVAAQPDQLAFGFAEREVHRPDPIGPSGTDRSRAVRSAPWRPTAPRTRSRTFDTRGGGAPAPQAAAGRRLPDLRALRLRRGHGRAHHGPRPRAARPLLGQPARHELQADPGEGPPPRQRPGRGRRRHLAGEQGGVRDPLPDPRRPPRRRLRRPRPFRVRQGVVVAAPPARSAHPGRLCVLRRPRRVRRLHRRRARPRGGQAHRPRPRATARPPSCRTTACSPSGAPSTRRPGGSSRWSARARRSCWPRRPAPRCSSTRTWPR